MSNTPTCSAEHAVQLFSRGLPAAPDRILAQVDAEAGVAQLCAIEAAIVAHWRDGVGKELVWLTRDRSAQPSRLQLRAFDAHGAVLAEAAFILLAPQASEPLERV